MGGGGEEGEVPELMRFCRGMPTDKQESECGLPPKGYWCGWGAIYVTLHRSASPRVCCPTPVREVRLRASARTLGGIYAIGSQGVIDVVAGQVLSVRGSSRSVEAAVNHRPVHRRCERWTLRRGHRRLGAATSSGFHEKMSATVSSITRVGGRFVIVTWSSAVFSATCRLLHRGYLFTAWKVVSTRPRDTGLRLAPYGRWHRSGGVSAFALDRVSSTFVPLFFFEAEHSADNRAHHQGDAANNGDDEVLRRKLTSGSLRVAV